MINMHRVSFIYTESGDDLIVSFAIPEGDDPGSVESLTLLRTPKFEAFLEDCERGVTVSFDEVDDSVDMLCEVVVDEEHDIVTLKSQKKEYPLDVRKVEKKEISSMKAIFRKMCFDDRFTMKGV